MTKQPAIPEVMSVLDLAAYLHRAPVTIYRLLPKGKLPGRKLGGQWRILKADIDAWLRDERPRTPVNTKALVAEDHRLRAAAEA